MQKAEANTGSYLIDSIQYASVSFQSESVLGKQLGRCFIACPVCYSNMIVYCNTPGGFQHGCSDNLLFSFLDSLNDLHHGKKPNLLV
mmetsp:Transcript_7102/g.13062  ORF Transcript_7102/g.13062 Transcript_7102/m.13062 type:complete len:87 (-) Transcript_7102:179-439(-)